MKLYEITFAAEIKVPARSEQEAVDAATEILLAHPRLMYVFYVRTNNYTNVYDPNERPVDATEEQTAERIPA